MPRSAHTSGDLFLTWWKGEREDPDADVFYVCPDCGYAQKSNAEKRIECHRCGRSYKKRDAKTRREKRPDEDLGTGFGKFRPADQNH